MYIYFIPLLMIIHLITMDTMKFNIQIRTQMVEPFVEFYLLLHFDPFIP